MNATAPVSPAPLPIALADVEAAALAIAGKVIRTPCLKSETLSAMTGAQVWLKFENLQFTAAYKERGALNRLLTLTAEERARGVIAASAGNHAQGLAYHARRLGIPATIVMPRFTPIVKVQQTESHDANVVLFGEKYDDASAHALELAEKKGLVYVHPFDDAKVMAGQGTVGLEMLEDVPELDTLVVPIGGGGLISGIATVAKAQNREISVIGVQAELYPSMYAAMKGQSATCDGDTLAEGIAVKNPGKLTQEVVRALVDDIVLVGERDLERAVSLLLGIEKTVVEGAGAAGLAALLAHPRRFKGAKVGLVLCGGNIDTRLLASVLTRSLVREKRITSIRIIGNDQPGLLAKVSTVIGDNGGNIIEVFHNRMALDVPAKGAEFDITIETRDARHTQEIIDALNEAGFPPRTN